MKSEKIKEINRSEKQAQVLKTESKKTASNKLSMPAESLGNKSTIKEVEGVKSQKQADIAVKSEKQPEIQDLSKTATNEPEKKLELNN